MASFVPTSPETLEDQRLYTTARLTTVACLDCLARVGVKKNSDHHTSIQWRGGGARPRRRVGLADACQASPCTWRRVMPLAAQARAVEFMCER